MHVLPYGDRAVLVEVTDTAAARSLHAALVAAALPGVEELVPATRTVLVVLDPAVTTPEQLRLAVLAVEPAVAERQTGTTVQIPVVYDGEDLAEVARLTGLTVHEVVERHLAGDYVAAFGGFAPGFAYLTGLDPALHVPRLDSPRVRVPAGAVAIAGELAAVYPRSSPGGWRLLGRTDLVLFDTEREPPALLMPGTRVRFVAHGPATDGPATHGPAAQQPGGERFGTVG